MRFKGKRVWRINFEPHVPCSKVVETTHLHHFLEKGSDFKHLPESSPLLEKKGGNRKRKKIALL